mgnify:CR=1 FL=1
MDITNRADNKTEKTLFEAIGDLQQVADKIDSLIFGDRPQEEQVKPMVGDRITQARDNISYVAESLRRAIARLEIL